MSLDNSQTLSPGLYWGFLLCDRQWSACIFEPPTLSADGHFHTLIRCIWTTCLLRVCWWENLPMERAEVDSRVHVGMALDGWQSDAKSSGHIQPWQKLHPVPLILGAKDSEEAPNLLDDSLHFDCGWQPTGRLTETPSLSMNLNQSLDVKCEPQSLPISSAMPKYQNTWVTINSVVLNAVGRLDRGIQ